MSSILQLRLRTKLSLLVACLALGALAFGFLRQRDATAFKIIWPHFDLVGHISEDGLTVTLTGVFGCIKTEGDWIIEASVTQEETMAAAVGVTSGECRGVDQSFTVEAFARPGQTTFGIQFEEGIALVNGLGTLKQGRSIVKTTIWTQYIPLVRAQ
jgi:hypothetical protein